jgi:predicted Zn-dependent protease
MPRPLPPAGAAAPLAPVVKRALELHRQNSVGEAEELCLEVLELAPGQPEALALLYRIRHAQGAERAAETLLRRIVTLYPNTFWATNELTLALLAKGAITEAEIHARNAVRIAPENPQSHNSTSSAPSSIRHAWNFRRIAVTRALPATRK